MKQLRVEVKIKNNRLYRLIHEHHPSSAAFAHAMFAAGYSASIPSIQGHLYALMSFKEPAYVMTFGRIRPTKFAMAVCSSLEKPMEYVFPPETCSESRYVAAAVEVNMNELRALSFREPAREIGWDDPAKSFEHVARKSAIDSALGQLNDRERKILQLRYAPHERSYADIGKMFRVSRERVRQIEDRAIRKLRHPTRCRGLRDYA